MDVANSEPLRIAKMRVATTIVGDDVVYGFLPDTKSFASTVYAGYDQPSLDAVVTMKDSQLIDDATAEKEYASLEANEKRFGTYSFTAEVEAGSSAIFQMDFLGNGEKVDALKLYKLAANSKTEYTYGRPSASRMGLGLRPVVDRLIRQPHCCPAQRYRSGKGQDLCGLLYHS